MSEFLQTVIGGVVTVFGSTATAWMFARVREALREWRDTTANEALHRLFDIVGVVALDSTEVLTRSLVEALKDGNLTPQELTRALDEAQQVAWSLMRNADKRALAGGIDAAAQHAFKPILRSRIEAEARRRVVGL